MADSNYFMAIYTYNITNLTVVSQQNSDKNIMAIHPGYFILLNIIDIYHFLGFYILTASQDFTGPNLYDNNLNTYAV